MDRLYEVELYLGSKEKPRLTVRKRENSAAIYYGEDGMLNISGPEEGFVEGTYRILVREEVVMRKKKGEI